MALIVSCSDAAPTPPSPSKAGDPAPPPPPPPPPATLVIISAGTIVVAQGDTVGLGAVVVNPNGRRSPTEARWTSSDTHVVTTGLDRAIAIAPGKAIITADRPDNPSLHDQVPVVVVAKPAGIGPSALSVQGFSMTEFQYPSGPDGWFYAPQVQVTAAPGHTALVSYLIFSIPGLDDPIPGWVCPVNLGAGSLADLNGEVYGDWAMSITGHGRATGADATARITYTDDSGVTSTLTVHGPIVHGALPTTYSGGGGGLGGACFGVYGSG